MKEYHMHNEADTRAFGLRLAARLQAGDVVALIGELGTGKTRLSGYIAEGLGIREVVASPTFTLVREYRSGNIPLFHFDCYRLTDSEDVFQSGIEEYFYAGGICLVEWADHIMDILPETTQYIQLAYGEKEGERIFRCTC